MRAWLCGCWSLCAIAAISASSAGVQGPKFEVASIKRLTANTYVGPRRMVADDTFFRPGATVTDLVQFAYGVTAVQIDGGPEWTSKDRFEVMAKASGSVSPDDMKALVQTLLRERFQLVAHVEQRELRRAELVLANPGRTAPGLERCERRMGAPGPGAANPTSPSPAARPMAMPRDGIPLAGQCVPMSVLVSAASRIVGVPVVDRTGLDGFWNYMLTYGVPEIRTSNAGVPSTEPATPMFPTALEDVLGLKLNFGRGPIDVVVIDAVQPPTEN